MNRKQIINQTVAEQAIYTYQKAVRRTPTAKEVHMAARPNSLASISLIAAAAAAAAAASWRPGQYCCWRFVGSDSDRTTVHGHLSCVHRIQYFASW
jgi:hypothetical protein